MDEILSPYELLLGLAARQRGYFSAGQARDYGVSYRTVDYWRSRGRFMQIEHGVYRLSGYFSEGLLDDTWPIWLASGRDSVVSHQTALVFHGLSDLFSDGIHITVERSHRGRHYPSRARVHTVVHPIPLADVINFNGIPITDVERTLADCAAIHVQLDQLEKACQQAITSGLTTTKKLLSTAAARSATIEQLLSRMTDTNSAD